MCQQDADRTKATRSRALTLAVLIGCSLPITAAAEERAGVVTNVLGAVTVSRASTGDPAPLRFRDSIFVRDRIVTGESAVARILLGGHAVVTVREHSVVTITQAPNLSTVAVGQGAIAVAVARERMRAGDLVEVRTPNAVAGIRGTVVVAEVRDSRHSTITVLKGFIDVRRLEAGNAIGAPKILNRLERVIINDTPTVTSPQAISAETARRLGDDFRLVPPRTAPPAAAAPVVEAEIVRAVASFGPVIPPPSNASATGVSADDGNAKAAKAGTAAANTTSLPVSSGTPGPTSPASPPAPATAVVPPSVVGSAASTARTPSVTAGPPASVPTAIGAAAATVNPAVAATLQKIEAALEKALQKQMARDSRKGDRDRSGSNRGRD